MIQAEVVSPEPMRQRTPDGYFAIIGIRQRQRQAVIVGFVGLCIIAHIADPGHCGSVLLGGGSLRLVDFAVGTDLILLPGSPFSFLRTSAQTYQSPAPALQTAVNPRQAPAPKWRREDQTTTCTVQLALRLPWRSGMPARQGHVPPPVPLHCRCDRPALRAQV